MLTSKTFRTVAGGGYGLKLYLHPTAGRDHVSERRPDLAGIRRMDDLHPGKHSLHRSEGCARRGHGREHIGPAFRRGNGNGRFWSGLGFKPLEQYRVPHYRTQRRDRAEARKIAVPRIEIPPHV